MTDQLLSELRKLRSTRTNLGLLAGMLALILLSVLINGLVLSKADLRTHDYQHNLLSAGTSGALFAALIGVMAMTSEFRHGTIRPTFVVTPHRTRVIVAKVLTSLLMGILFGLAAIALSFGLGYAVLSARGIPLVLGTNHVVLLVFGTLVMTALWAEFGVGLGAVIKNQVFAVIVLIVWAMIVDNLLRGLVPSVGRFTPVGASDSLTAGYEDYLLSPLAGGMLLVGYVAVFVAAGSLLVARRDVT
jgi:ABC-type transport system involved in multi-copper enzyme maturation permease subunit